MLRYLPILLLFLIFMIILAVYLYHLIGRVFDFFEKKRRRWLLIILTLVLIIPTVNVFSLWSAILLYVTMFALMIDLIRFLLQKKGRNLFESGRGKAIHTFLLIPVFLTAMIFCYAYFNMHHIVQTDYSLTTTKSIRSQGYKIAYLSDLHFGTTMKEQELQKISERIQKEAPDMLVLGGDIVDENTTKAEMEDAFHILSGIKTDLGIYYVYGNHDKSSYSGRKNFTPEELASSITANHIYILEDRAFQITDELYITGRKDRSVTMFGGPGRKSAAELAEGMDPKSYQILADHQPREMKEDEKAGFDLMLSGHTHAGQMWPVGLLTTLFDKGTVNYGRKEFGSMELVVSSGIGGWGYPFRTGKHSEFVILHLNYTK